MSATTKTYIYSDGMVQKVLAGYDEEVEALLFGEI